MGQTPIPTKLATIPEPTPKDTQEKGKPIGQPEPEPVPTLKMSGSTPHTPFGDMVAIARQVLAANLDIANRIMEHMRVRPFVLLQLEDLVPLLVGEQRRVAEVESQRVAEASPNTCSTLVFFRTSPMGKLHLTPRKEVGFPLDLSQQTSLVQIGFEGTSLEPILVEDQPEVVGADPENEPGQEDLVTPFPEGAKTRPMTRSANKKGPSPSSPTSMKRPTKTPGKGSSSKRPKR